MRASATFCFEDGLRPSSCMAPLAVRMRVSMSAMGSVIVIGASSPTCLRDAGDLAGVRHLPKADAAQAELPVHRTRPPATPATRVGAHLELRLALLLLDQGLLRHSRCPSLLPGPVHHFLPLAAPLPPGRPPR